MRKAPEIAVAGIRTLTDARYFAAMGADWMGFELGGPEAIGPELVTAIIDWVEGPQYFVDTGDLEKPGDIVAQITDHLPVSAAVVDDATDMHLPGIRTYVRRISGRAAVIASPHQIKQDRIVYLDLNEMGSSDILNDEPLLEALQAITAKCPCWLETTWRTATIKDLLKSVSVKGVVLRGSEDDVTGVKSFAEADLLFEILRAN